MAPSDTSFRYLVENVRDQAIVFVDTDGVVQSWNAGAQQLTGYARHEAIGKSVAMFFSDDAVAAGLPQRSLAEALRTGSFEDIGWRRRKDGSRFWAQATTTAIHDDTGAHIGFAKVIRDLRDSAYRAFVEATNAIVWSADNSGGPNADSPSWRAFTGQSEAEWMQGGGAFAPVHPDDVETLRVAWTSARQTGGALECEFRLRRHDGVYVWMVVRALPLLNPDGRVREWFGVTVDIAARKKAESEVETSAGWWTTTLTSIGDAVVATDQSGAVRFMNPVAERLTGYSLAEAQGKPLVEIFHIVNEATRVAVENPVAKVLAEGVVVGLANHTILVRRDKTEIPIDDSAAPIRTKSGALDGVVLVFRDVSHEKQAAARRDFLAHVGLELMRTASYRDSLSMVARLAVPHLADWCTVEIREAGAVHGEQLAVAHVDAAKIAFAKAISERYPPDRDAPTGVPNVLRTGKSELYRVVPQDLLEAGCKDAEHLRLVRELKLHSAMVVPLLARDARVLGAITFIYAESGREYCDDDLAFAEDLARRAALVIERRKLEDEASEANRTKDEFLATISHELRTPLQAMLGWATMLKRGTARDPKKAVEAILRNAHAQARLVDDILDVSRIISGKLRMSMGRVDLAQAIQAALDAVRPTAQARHIELRAQLTSIALVGDADRLQQVVWNLVNNAVKFTDAGGVVEVTTSIVDDRVRIAVRDTGRGIAREHLGSIFERFRQVDGSATRERGGLGLGLAIVRYLAEAHGGSVDVTSDGVGHGSTFTVTLPLRTPQSTAAGTPMPVAGQSLRGVRILVVDDDPDSREIVGEVLSDAGARIELAGSAAEAFRVFEREPPQVVVSDIGMPIEDGYSLMARIRALPPEKGGDVPAIALTAYARAEDVKRAEEVGFQRHLAKPVQPDTLIAAVRSVTAESVTG